MRKSKVWGLLVVMAVILVLGWVNFKNRIVALNFLTDTDDYQIRVLTWNIHGQNQLDSKKQADIAEIIISQESDIVLLNEFTLDSCLVIDSLLSLYYPYKEEARARTRAGDIFYAMMPLVESGKFKRIKPYKRVQALQAKVCLEDDSLFIIGCHLSGNNRHGQIGINDTDSLRKMKTFWGQYRHAQEMRMGNASSLKKIITDSDLPIIVMGDMNDFEASAPMDSLKDAGLRNAWWEGGFGYGATYHEGWLRLRIDHICYNDKLRLKGVRVVKTDLSDHNILLADFSLAN